MKTRNLLCLVLALLLCIPQSDAGVWRLTSTDSTKVSLTGDETVAGVKTFSSQLIVSDSTASTSPTTGSIKTAGGLGAAGAIFSGAAITATTNFRAAAGSATVVAFGDGDTTGIHFNGGGVRISSGGADKIQFGTNTNLLNNFIDGTGNTFYLGRYASGLSVFKGLYIGDGGIGVGYTGGTTYTPTQLIDVRGVAAAAYAIFQNTATGAGAGLQVGVSAGGVATIGYSTTPATITFATNGDLQMSGSIRSLGQLIGKGTVAGDQAVEGVIGEYKEAVISTATNVATTNEWGDNCNMTLTAGDWDISLFYETRHNGATITQWQIGISSTTGNSATGLTSGENRVSVQVPDVTFPNTMGAVPNYRRNITSPTTFYGKAIVTYTVATPQYRCRLSARRVR